MEEQNMRAEVLRVARGWQRAARVLLVLAFAACATSPTEQLNRAEQVMARLESNGAEAYLKYELAAARQKLEEARKFIRKNRFEVASQYLQSLCQTLDSCGVAFVQLRQRAQQQSQQQLHTLSARLDTLRAMVASLPRQSYIDQNRYDIYTHRLRRYHNEIGTLQKLIEQEEFPMALQRGAKLALQIEQSWTGLLETTDVKLSTAVTALRPSSDKTIPVMATSTR
jgi:hypothetical protein